MKWISIQLLLAAFIFSGCDDNFQYSPNEVSLKKEEKDLNQRNISKIQATDTLRVIFISDIHHSYEELEDFVNHANSQQGISFIMIGGDFTNFGLQEEYRNSFRWLKELKMPFIGAIGNHDLLGNGEEVFKQMYGSLNFSFTANGNKFIVLNTNSREYDFHNVPDMSWLRSQLEDSADYTNAVVIGHCPPFDADFDPEIQPAYTKLLADYKVNSTFYGHTHTYSKDQRYNDSVNYVVTGSLASRSYVMIKLFKDYISSEQINF